MREQLEEYLEAIRQDYLRWTEPDTQVKSEMVESFNQGLCYIETPLYFKVITHQGASRSVHSFIVKEDGAQFKRGDILKAAGWNAPAKNKARGNIFGPYHINWTGPDYLRG